MLPKVLATISMDCTIAKPAAKRACKLPAKRVRDNSLTNLPIKGILNNIVCHNNFGPGLANIILIKIIKIGYDNL